MSDPLALKRVVYTGGLGIMAATGEHELENRVREALRRKLMEKEGASEVVEAPVVEEKVVEKSVVCKDGQVLFSKLIGKRLRAGLRDFAVTVFDPTVWSEEVKGFIPALNPGYNIQVEEAHALGLAWEMGEKCLVTGPTGSGKSSLVEYLCALTQRPLLRINMTGDIESTVLFGQLVVENGATVWKDGPVTEAVRFGAVAMIDEWDVTPPEILFGLQWLLEESGKLFLKEMPGDANSKFIVPHTDFRLVCLGNTVGQGDDTGRYSGTNVQNNASIDRFQTTIVLDYLDAKHEVKIVKDNCPGIDDILPIKMVSFASLVREAVKQNNINLTMSPRTLINWGKKTVVFGDIRRALTLAYANKLRESDRKIVGEFYAKVFGGTPNL